MTGEASVESTILVVEDDPEIRESLCDVLGDRGYRVVAAANGQEALERLHESERPSLILLDLMMPVMDGAEFLAVLRNDPALATLPVVIVSAWSKEAGLLREQVEGIVKKPVSLRDLLETVARFCGRPTTPDASVSPEVRP
jgi:CheY-like chemotaxis protein